MTVIAFPAKAQREGGSWPAVELNELVETFAPQLGSGEAGGWNVGVTEIGDPQFYLLGPPPDDECILCISRLGRVYVLEDGAGQVLFEHDSLLVLAEQAHAAQEAGQTLPGPRFTVRGARAEEKIEPIVGESGAADTLCLVAAFMIAGACSGIPAASELTEVAFHTVVARLREPADIADAESAFALTSTSKPASTRALSRATERRNGVGCAGARNERGARRDRRRRKQASGARRQHPVRQQVARRRPQAEGGIADAFRTAGARERGSAAGLGEAAGAAFDADGDRVRSATARGRSENRIRLHFSRNARRAWSVSGLSR